MGSAHSVWATLGLSQLTACVLSGYTLLRLQVALQGNCLKWALGSVTTNKANGGDGIPAELFQILKDDAVNVLHSISQQIWKTQQIAVIRGRLNTL